MSVVPHSASRGDGSNSSVDRQDAGGPRSNDIREEQVQERTPPNALVVLEVIRREGEEELDRKTSGLAFSGLAAGLSVGFSLVAEGLLRVKLPDTPWRPLISKLGYSVGFIIVVLGRQQLFTENTLTPILVLLTRRDCGTLLRVLRLWLVVLAANLVGALVFAWVVSHSQVFPPEIKKTFLDIGRESLSGSASSHLVRGIFAGWLIALMVWLLPSAEQARLQTILILSYMVGLGEFSHVVAGSINTLYAVMMGSATWGQYWLEFMLPTLIGNIIGGTLLVGALNYGQVASEVKK